MAEIPTVRLLETIRPVNAGTGETTLAYEGLSAAVTEYRRTNNARFARVWDAEPGGLDELGAARQLAFEYFLATAEKVVEAATPARHDLWADRFTAASIELYGEPEITEAAHLLVQEHDFISNLVDSDAATQEPVNYLLQTYTPIIEIASPLARDLGERAGAAEERLAIQRYGLAIKAKYQPLFDLVDKSGKTTYEPSDLQILFMEALRWLAEHDDPAWQEWQAPMKPIGSFFVSTARKSFDIPEKRAPATPDKAKGLLAHELLVHALRSKNGTASGVKKLGVGFPGYMVAEEGLGVLSEVAVIGKLSPGTQSNYLDVALALGTIDGRQRSRQELYQISFARNLIRAQLNAGSGQIDSHPVSKATWNHIDRIYRGGRGDNLGNRQAIFTNDIIYYLGYKKMAAFMRQHVTDMRSAVAVLEHLSCGKFDPTDSTHVDSLPQHLRLSS